MLLCARSKARAASPALLVLLSDSFLPTVRTSTTYDFLNCPVFTLGEYLKIRHNLLEKCESRDDK